MNCRAAFFVLSWLLLVANLMGNSMGNRVIGRTIYHSDKSRTEAVTNPETREMVETTYSANNQLLVKKVFLLNDKGEPLQGNVYDGQGNLVARCKCEYDELGRRKQDLLMNLQGQVFQQVLHEYGADGKALQPKVLNLKNVQAPTVRPAIKDFTQSTPAPNSPDTPSLAAPAQDRYAPVTETTAPPAPGSTLPTGQVAPLHPPEPEKKPNLWQRIFKKKEKK